MICAPNKSSYTRAERTRAEFQRPSANITIMFICFNLCICCEFEILLNFVFVRLQRSEMSKILYNTFVCKIPLLARALVLKAEQSIHSAKRARATLGSQKLYFETLTEIIMNKMASYFTNFWIKNSKVFGSYWAMTS